MIWSGTHAIYLTKVYIIRAGFYNLPSNSRTKCTNLLREEWDKRQMRKWQPNIEMQILRSVHVSVSSLEVNYPKKILLKFNLNAWYWKSLHLKGAALYSRVSKSYLLLRYEDGLRRKGTVSDEWTAGKMEFYFRGIIDQISQKQKRNIEDSLS